MVKDKFYANYWLAGLRRRYYNNYRKDYKNARIAITNSLLQEKEEEDDLKNEIKCPNTGAYGELELNLSNMNPENISKELITHFYNVNVLSAVSCILKSIKHPGDGFTENEAMRRYSENIKRIGDDSAFGVVMSEDLSGDHHKIAHNFAVVKVAKPKKSNSAEKELIHEYYVGRHYVNKLREECPNFSYTFESFYCNFPHIDKNKKASLFCSSNSNKVLHVMTESIQPSFPFEKLMEKCTAKEFIMYYLQVMLATEHAVDKYGIWHGDLHHGNVLLKEVPFSDFSIKYREKEHDSIYLKSDGLLAVIIDNGSLKVIGTEKNPVKYAYNKTGIYKKEDLSGRFLSEYTMGKYAGWSTNGVLPILFPLHDAYKLLMFSFKKLISEKRFDVFDELYPLLSFFLDDGLKDLIRKNYVNPDDYVMDEYDDELDGFFSLPAHPSFIGAEPFKKYVDLCINFAEKYGLVTKDLGEYDIELKMIPLVTDDSSNGYQKILSESKINPTVNIPNPQSLYDLINAEENYKKIAPNYESMMKYMVSQFNLKKAIETELTYIKTPEIFSLLIIPNIRKDVVQDIEHIMLNMDRIAEFLTNYSTLKTEEKIINETHRIYRTYNSEDLLKNSKLPEKLITPDMVEFIPKINQALLTNISILNSLLAQKFDKKSERTKELFESMLQKYNEILTVSKTFT